MKDKVLILSHKADPDGALPVVLTSLIYENYDYEFLDVDETDNKVLELLDDDTYDIIYMTDLSISDDTCDKVMNSKLKDKFKLFDHHVSRIEINKYPFATSIDVNDMGIKQCGTSIYYKYLKTISDNKILDKEVTKKIVELVRQLDTWDWAKTNNIESKKIGDLFDIYGREYFIEVIKDKILNNDTFSYTDKEEYLLKIEDIRINNYIERKKEKLIHAIIDGHKVGIVFAESYRSLLGNKLALDFENEIEFIIIISIGKSVSYRSLNDNDVSVFAQKYGGGGHKNASGSAIKDEIREKVIKMLFDDVKILSIGDSYEH